MVVRALKAFYLGLTVVLMMNSAASACFGPKLFIGAGSSVTDEVMFSLVSLYVKEKTGVESNRVIFDDEDPRREIVEERVDLAFGPATFDEEMIVLAVEGYPVLVTGKRPLEDIQFTTVVPAIRKLSRLLTTGDVAMLVEKVDAGESPMAAVRNFMMERRWI